MAPHPSRHGPSAPGRLRTISIVLLLLVAMGGVGNLVFTSAAYAAKPGQSCTKVGLRSGSYICTKTKGKLIWQVFKKKAQTISVQFPQRVPFTSNAFSITYSASSGLKVASTTLSPVICTVAQNFITPITPGQCLIRLSQSGNALFLSAKTKDVAVFIIGENQISFNPTNSLLLSTGTYSLTGTSTSGLALTYQTLTPETCSVSDSTLSLIKVGLCSVRASQSGSEIYPAATLVDASITIQGTNQISFSLPSSLLLSTKIDSLSGTSTSGLPLTYESLTPDTCSISAAILTLTKLGLCTIRASQSGSSLYLAAPSVDASITISDIRVTSDQPDLVTGFQIHAIYVIPSDGIDHSYDTNGYIAGILDEGNNYVQSQLGLQIPIDKNPSSYDIQFLKSSLSTADLQGQQDLMTKLLTESKVLENPGTNRKDYIFFVDVNILKNGDACGYANMPGLSAIVAIGETAIPTTVRCTGASLNFNNYATRAWVHELFHNFGVDHTLDTPCDLMSTGSTPCPSNSLYTIDKERTRYIGSSAQGQDILKLPVWEGYTGKNYSASCSLNPVPRVDGFKYAYCPTGIQTIGEMSYCWNSISSASLEEFIDGQWKSLGSGNNYSEPWGPNVYSYGSTTTWKCTSGTAPWKQLTVTTPGISLYRWMINGTEYEPFKVIWVR